VCADLATFLGERRKPVGPSETFAGAGGASSSRPVAVTTDDYAAVLLRIGGAARGAFHVSQMVAGRKNRVVLEVAGSEGSLAWDSERPDRLRIGGRKGPNQVLDRDPALLSPEAAALSDYPGGHTEGFPDTFKQLFRAVYGWIADGGKGPARFPTFDDGDREVRLCEAIARSAREERWVSVEAAGGG
jgi:predicted dehydrogenase